jgi:hypothetical protein
MRRINTRLIRAKYSYLLQELADDIGCHVNTISNWIKHEGLQRIDGIYPYMLYGQVVIEFLKSRQLKNKSKLLLNEFHCCTCQASCRAWEGIATIKTINSKIAMLQAVCEQCNGKINKLISLKNIAEIENAFTIHTLPPEALVQSTNTNSNCETKGA